MTKKSLRDSATGQFHHRRKAVTVPKTAAVGDLPAWKLEDAKARFSEVVRSARERGPQRVTYRGKDAVVVISVEELARLLPTERPRQSIVEFLRNSGLGDLDVERAPDRGREIDL